MPIYFRSMPVGEPFTFDSVGNHWSQEGIVRPKGHPHYHYLQSQKGSGCITIQGERYIMQEGEGVMIAPFIAHSYYGEGEEWHTLFATFTGTMESDIAKMIGNRQVIFVQAEQGAHIESLIHDVMKRCENPPTDAKALSVDCYGMLMQFADGIYTHDMKKDPLYQRYVVPVVKEIETCYDRELSVQGLSGMVYVTPQYLSRLFGRFLGCSVYEYLTGYRINKAKELLLLDSHIRVQEIARQVGFQDASHFIAVFKKVTGITPLEFRRLN